MIDATQILRQSLQATRFDEFAQTASAQSQVKPTETGAALGLKLETMEDPMAQLQDSMEEISGHFEEKAMKEIGQRKLGQLKGKMMAYVMAVEKWTKAFPDLPHDSFLDRMIKQLKQQDSQTSSPRDILRRLGRSAGDPSHQFALLDIMEQTFAAEKNDSLAKLMQEAKKLLDAERGAEVKAGLNLAEEVKARAGSNEEMQGLRDLYRSEVLGFTKPQDCFRSLIASRGAGRLNESLDFLMKGCGIDMQSATPSRSPEELRRVMLDLQCVDVLRTMLESCDQLVGKMAKEFSETSLLNGEQLSGKIVDFTEMPFVSSQDIAGLLTTCGFAQLLAKLYFTTRLTDLFRGLSPRLFDDDGGGRFKLIDAAQEHLDGLVALEEEEEKKAREKREETAA